jgi:hypothetical protein
VTTSNPDIVRRRTTKMTTRSQPADGQEWQQDLDATPGWQLPDTQASGGQTLRSHLYKNPVLYAIGGLFLPPLVLFLMGGNRATCAWMVGLWVLFWITVWMMGIGAIFAIAVDIWSVIACYQEAVKQNQANGLA